MTIETKYNFGDKFYSLVNNEIVTWTVYEIRLRQSCALLGLKRSWKDIIYKEETTVITLEDIGTLFFTSKEALCKKLMED